MCYYTLWVILNKAENITFHLKNVIQKEKQTILYHHYSQNNFQIKSKQFTNFQIKIHH